MSALGELHEDLEAHLTAATDDQAAASTAGMFKITNLETATWAVRKIAKARRWFDEAQLLAEVERQRIDEFLAGERARLERDTQFLAGLLEGYHRTVLDDDPKAKSIATPAGKLVARKQPDRVDVADLDAFMAWATENAGDLLRVKWEPDKNAIKQELTPAGDQLVNGDGEIVPGLTWVVGVTKFSVDTGAST